MKLKRYLLLLLSSFLFGCALNKINKSVQCESGTIRIKSKLNGSDQSIIKGKAIDKVSGESLPFVKIILSQKKMFISGTTTDMDGDFTFNQVPPGNYELSFNNSGYNKIETTIKIDQSSTLNIEVQLIKLSIKIAKPVLYLYPVQTQSVTIAIKYQGKIIHSYPTYPESGWNVTAEPNGTLHDKNGQEYYALFWEGISDKEYIPKNGFVVSGNETAGFLEEKLAILGLNRREANEFIMYWLPQLEKNPYNLIHFSENEYENEAILDIHPKPETMIRCIMVTQALQSKIKFPIQDLSALKKTRKGFTVVEWGGCILNNVESKPEQQLNQQ